MLSESTINIVKSTVPALQENGLSITEKFYEILFEAAPDLKHVFNMSNQRNASQSRALADAVLAYANNIDNIEVLVPAVKRIANKHSSIGVEAHHYPLVGASLLKAIQQVLSLPDNHPALEAWGEAYGVLASIFIGAESELYTASEQAAGGWRGFRAFNIIDIKVETPEVKSFILKPTDNAPVLNFSGGQYVGLKILGNATGYDQIRQYSLSNWSTSTDSYRLTVKKEPEGTISNGLHDYAIGDSVLLSPPFGEFTLNSDAQQHVFISGGVGITPLFSMLQQAVASGMDKTNLLFVECCRGREHQIFKEELKQLANAGATALKQVFEYGDGGDFSGRLTPAVLNSWLIDKSAQVYFCGPLPFMSELKRQLNSIGFADEQLHYEVFGPTTSL
ncbi:NO-inducible flavohemoprotein [Zhongshania marina]|uniref:nitric oxide dioxygenase n=1 Tax=Zhongshania marina TaxID=2304603 RepID=A0A2S4HE69_9GAMM|nr:NO-inducible flavohemoprotein [Marortus luteolus]POP52286.1 NO-inducible flavohemoprotein [Marortus luteolus]